MKNSFFFFFWFRFLIFVSVLGDSVFCFGTSSVECRGQHTSSEKGQIVNILSFMDCVVPVLHTAIVAPNSHIKNTKNCMWSCSSKIFTNIGAGPDWAFQLYFANPGSRVYFLISFLFPLPYSLEEKHQIILFFRGF